MSWTCVNTSYLVKYINCACQRDSLQIWKLISSTNLRLHGDKSMTGGDLLWWCRKWAGKGWKLHVHGQTWACYIIITGLQWGLPESRKCVFDLELFVMQYILHLNYILSEELSPVAASPRCNKGLYVTLREILAYFKIWAFTYALVRNMIRRKICELYRRFKCYVQ
jgi:hypothetical protein